MIRLSAPSPPFLQGASLPALGELGLALGSRSFIRISYVAVKYANTLFHFVMSLAIWQSLALSVVLPVGERLTDVQDVLTGR